MVKTKNLVKCSYEKLWEMILLSTNRFIVNKKTYKKLNNVYNWVFDN